MCIALAIIGAAATVYAGHEAASATKDAANTAAGAQYAALSQEKQLAAPYTGLGETAVPQLENLLGMGKGGSAGALSTLRDMPGYKFAQQQGTQATENAATAMGLGLSGNTLQGLSQFNQGLADQTYQQEVGNLENVVGIGQAAAAGQAANIGNAATNIGNIAIGRGNALAGIDANTVAGLTKAVGGAANQYIGYNTLQNLMGGQDVTQGAGWYNYNSPYANTPDMADVQPIPDVSYGNF